MRSLAVFFVVEFLNSAHFFFSVFVPWFTIEFALVVVNTYIHQVDVTSTFHFVTNFKNYYRGSFLVVGCFKKKKLNDKVASILRFFYFASIVALRLMLHFDTLHSTGIEHNR